MRASQGYLISTSRWARAQTATANRGFLSTPYTLINCLADDEHGRDDAHVITTVLLARGHSYGRW